jgi:hypothetical protein
MFFKVRSKSLTDLDRYPQHGLIFTRPIAVSTLGNGSLLACRHRYIVAREIHLMNVCCLGLPGQRPSFTGIAFTRSLKIQFVLNQPRVENQAIS